MDHEEDGITHLSKSNRVADIIERHTHFKKEPFQPRPIIGRVFYRSSSWFGKIQRLHPVAFKVRINMIEMMGCVSSSGGMDPYLWLDADNRLVTETKTGRYAPVDADLLTDEDITALEIGIQGDEKLLRVEYEKIYEAMLAELGA